MITDALFSFFVAIVTPLLNLLPTVTPPDLSQYDASLATALGYGGWMNQYLPLDQAGIMLGLAGIAWVAMHTFHAVMYVLTKAHVTGGSN